jgi:hypothetical protein
MLTSAAFGETKIVHTDSAPLMTAVKSNKKSISTEDNYNLTLKKNALGHLFLLHTSIINNPPSATGNPLAAKLVYFKHSGNFIGMFESTAGKLVTNSVTTEILLAKFPVVLENNEEVVFNFEAGMKILFQKSSYYIARPGSSADTEGTYKILESFINKVELRKNHIFIDQYLRVESPATRTAPASISPVQIKYTLSSYKKNENFKPMASPGFDYVGYFENHPVHTLDENGEINETKITHIKKFDMNKEITFHITNNVPKKYEQAVKDGVLYWNKAFGKEVIKVATLPENVTIHEPGYNIVQWLDWDTAGFAYAASNSDPLTGEIHQAHVFMTSSFATGSYSRVKTLLERLKKEEDKVAHHMGLSGFESSKLCDSTSQRKLSEVSRVKELISSVEEQDLTDEEKEVIYNRYVADYVREVVAHEVGHTLGFRHNFAASLDTTVDSSNYNTIAKKYLLTGSIDQDIKVGSSVMDYTPGYFSTFIGAKIRLEDAPLAYDQHVIDVAYLEKPMITELQFCTDDHAGKFYDCYRFDAFANVMEEKQFFMEESFKRLGHSIVSSNLSFLGNENYTRDQKLASLKHLHNLAELNVNWYAKNRFKPLAEKAKNGKRSRVIERLAPFSAESATSLNYHTEKTQEKISKDFAKIGGISKSLFGNLTPVLKDGVWLSPLSRITLDKANELLVKYYPELNSDDELKALAKKKIAEYVELFDKKFLMMSVQYIDQNYSVKEDNMIDSIYALASTLLNTTSKETTQIGQVHVNNFVFDYKISGKSLRKEAVDLLKAKYFPKSHSFQRAMKKSRAKAYGSFKEFEGMVNMTYQNIDFAPDDVYDYYMMEKDLYKLIK